MPQDKFTDKATHPTDDDLREKLGSSYPLVRKTIASLQSEHSAVSIEWKFSTTSGWYLTCSKSKKRLFYLFPAEGDFTFKITLNDRALEQIRHETFPKSIRGMIRDAKKYPEGTLLVFDKTNFAVATILQLLRNKMAS